MRLDAAYGSTGRAPEVLYLADSSSMVVSWDDRSQRPVAALVASGVRPRGTCVVGQFGYHAGVYRAVLRALAAMPRRPRVVLVPINLRQFSPQWAGNPNLAFSAEIESFEAYAASGGARIPVVEPFPLRRPWMKMSPDADAWSRHVSLAVDVPGRAERTVGELIDLTFSSPATPEAAADRFQALYAFHYAMPVAADHPRVAALADVFRLGESIGTTVVAWCNPVNHERGAELVGDRFEAALDATVATVREACGPGARILDTLRLLPSSGFFDSVEHYTEAGRRLLADHLIAAVDEVVPLPT